MCVKSLHSCPTLFNPMDWSPPGFSVHEILQARILEWVAISFFNVCMNPKSHQLCPTLCDPMDSSLPGFSVHEILQARILEWVAISFSREFSQPRDRTQVSHIGGRHFNLWATREAMELNVLVKGTPETSFICFSHVKTQQKDYEPSIDQEVGPHQIHKLPVTWSWTFQPPKLWEASFCCL